MSDDDDCYEPRDPKSASYIERLLEESDVRRSDG